MFDNSPSPVLRPRSTSQNVYELIRGDIVSGALKPGEVIRESKLSAQLGLSRTPVREALLRLANLGLIDIFPQSATRVAPIRLAKVRAAQLIRETVEVEVVRRACASADDAALGKLGHLIEDQVVAARRGDGKWLFELDETFHREIHAAAGQLAVEAELEELRVHLTRLRHVVTDWPRDGEQIICEHRSVLAALWARDADGAAEAMRIHLRALLPALDRIAAESAR